MKLRDCLVLFLIACLYAYLTLQWSERVGRLSMDADYDDIGYLSDGFDRLRLLDTRGPSAFWNSFFSSPPHSPWSTLTATLGFGIFGIRDWSPYAINALLIFFFFLAVCWILRSMSRLNKAALLLVILFLQLTLRAVHDFRPDFACALATALFSIAVLRAACFREWEQHERLAYFLIGLCAGAAFWIKPSFFAHTAVLLFLSFFLSELCRFILEKPRYRPLLRRLLFCLVGVVISAGPYFAFAWRATFDYFFSNAMDESSSSIWKVSGGVGNVLKLALFTGEMPKMIGPFFYLFLFLIIFGIWFLLRTKRMSALLFTLASLTVALASFTVIVYGRQQNPFFGLTWDLLLLFTSYFILSEIVGKQRFSGLIFAVTAISFILYLKSPSYLKVSYPSPDSTGENSLNIRAVQTIQEVNERSLPILPEPSVYVAFSGHVNGDTQKWITQKTGFPVIFKSRYISAKIQDHLSAIENSDFVEVADPQSKWMYKWLPSTALQPALLTYLRQKSNFHELPPLQGRQGVLYLFEKQR
jgi:hypothetical protein